MQVLLSSQEATRRLAETLAPLLGRVLGRGISLALTGGLGAGKTTFVRHLAGALGGNVPVSSPTFVLCHEYTGGVETLPSLIIEHWDVYRLSNPPEELKAGVGKDTLMIIEWANKFPDILSSCDLELEFELLEVDQRRMHLRGSNAVLVAAVGKALSEAGCEFW